jgi:hypothetical protein
MLSRYSKGARWFPGDVPTVADIEAALADRGLLAVEETGFEGGRTVTRTVIRTLCRYGLSHAIEDWDEAGVEAGVCHECRDEVARDNRAYAREDWRRGID